MSFNKNMDTNIDRYTSMAINTHYSFISVFFFLKDLLSKADSEKNLLPPGSIPKWSQVQGPAMPKPRTYWNSILVSHVGSQSAKT